MATPLDPPGPAVLTADQAKFIGKPPNPFDQSVPIIQPDGRPTPDYHLFMVKQYEWNRRLYAVLTGIG